MIVVGYLDARLAENTLEPISLKKFCARYISKVEGKFERGAFNGQQLISHHKVEKQLSQFKKT